MSMCVERVLLREKKCLGGEEDWWVELGVLVDVKVWYEIYSEAEDACRR